MSYGSFDQSSPQQRAHAGKPDSPSQAARKSVERVSQKLDKVFADVRPPAR